MDPTEVPPEAFEAMVVDALDSLPDWVVPVVQKIAVLVEDEQDPSERRPGVVLLGLYRGVPRTSHYGRAPGTLPDTITLYRVPIVEVCDRVEDVPDRVRTVLVHEVGHAMGLPESRLRELGWAQPAGGDESGPAGGDRPILDDVGAAVDEAKRRAGDHVVAVCARDVGGQALALGQVDAVAMDVVPVVFGAGKRYSGPVDSRHLLHDPSVVIAGDRALHLRYRTRR